MSPNVVHVYALVLVMLRVVLHSSQSAFDKFCDKKIGFFRMKETHFIVLLKSFFAVKLGAEIIQQRQQLLQQQLQNQQLQGAATSTASSTTSTESTASAASAFSALLPQEIIERPAITAKDKNNFFIFVFRLNNKTIFCASKTLQRYDLFWFLQTIFGFFLMKKCCKTHFLWRV